MSSDHFSVDGTLIEACGNAMIEHRHGLVADVELLANRTAECDAALVMAERIPGVG